MTNLTKAEDIDVQREQIRGLYIVGLLAVLVAFKLSSNLDPSADKFFALVIMLWGLYSFCMIFGYSSFRNPLFHVSEEKSEAFSAFLRTFAQIVLIGSLGASIAFAIWYFWIILWVSVIVVAIAGAVYYPIYLLRKRLKEKDKKPS